MSPNFIPEEEFEIHPDIRRMLESQGDGAIRQVASVYVTGSGKIIVVAKGRTLVQEEQEDALVITNRTISLQGIVIPIKPTSPSDRKLG